MMIDKLLRILRYVYYKWFFFLIGYNEIFFLFRLIDKLLRRFRFLNYNWVIFFFLGFFICLSLIYMINNL